MDSHSLERLLKLSQKTGDRLVIHDSQTDESMVIMNLDEYEHLIDCVFEDGQKAHASSGTESVRMREEAEPEEMAPPEDEWYRAKDILEEAYPNFAAEAEHDTPSLKTDIPKALEAPSIEPIVESSNEVWGQDPLPDEPVFYEEPV